MLQCFGLSSQSPNFNKGTLQALIKTTLPVIAGKSAGSHAEIKERQIQPIANTGELLISRFEFLL